MRMEYELRGRQGYDPVIWVLPLPGHDLGISLIGIELTPRLRLYDPPRRRSVVL